MAFKASAIVIPLSLGLALIIRISGRANQVPSVLKPPEVIEAMVFSPNSQALACGGGSSDVFLLDVKAQQWTKRLDPQTIHTGNINSIAFSPDGTTIASGSVEGMVRIWNAHEGKLNHALKHRHSVSSVAFAPDGRTLAVGTTVNGKKQTGEVGLWDTRTWTLKRSLEVPSGAVMSVAFSPDGNIVASSAFGKSVALWDTQTGELKRVLTDHGDPVWGVSFSPDGKLLASASSGEAVKLWEVRTGQLKQTLDPLQSRNVESLAFLPDGRKLVTRDGSIKLWDLLSGQMKAVIHGPHLIGFQKMALAPDGKMLATSTAGAVRLWSVNEFNIARYLGGRGGS